MDLARGLSSAKWADDGSLWQAFLASVRHLATAKQLDISVLHGDGTNTVAKKGGMGLGTRGTKLLYYQLSMSTYRRSNILRSESSGAPDL